MRRRREKETMGLEREELAEERATGWGIGNCGGKTSLRSERQMERLHMGHFLLNS